MGQPLKGGIVDISLCRHNCVHRLDFCLAFGAVPYLSSSRKLCSAQGPWEERWQLFGKDIDNLERIWKNGKSMQEPQCPQEKLEQIGHVKATGGQERASTTVSLQYCCKLLVDSRHNPMLFAYFSHGGVSFLEGTPLGSPGEPGAGACVVLKG